MAFPHDFLGIISPSIYTYSVYRGLERSSTVAAVVMAPGKYLFKRVPLL